ncbi:MAG TPA: hypothetical protein VEN82_03015, partial [Actinomycetota bacterium]|nr:hypothetical protein [Actinomycetota bacterium]
MRYDRANEADVAYALHVSPDGTRVFVTGGSSTSPGHGVFATAAYDASTGNKIWGRRDEPGSASAIGVSSDGSKVFVAGTTEGTGGSAYAAIAYQASSGKQLWVAGYDKPGTDGSTALSVSPDGSKVFVTGTSIRSGGAYYDYATVAL